MLAGKYRVERILGQGGMGIVVEARHLALDERVALKFLLPDYAQHPEASARFLREARAAAKIKNEHVARVTDHGTLENGSPYMVMEYLEGQDLSKLLETRGVLTLEDAVDYLVQGCEAIAEAHSHGIVHRDIKPANLFLTRRHNGDALVKVLDFGISKSSGGMDNLTKTTAAMGSALYMSPEQMQATKGVDHRTDIYALGVSLYELLAGKQPFYADTLPALCAEVFTGTPAPIREARPDLPEQFAQVLEKAYARDRAARYQTVAEFVIALAPWAPARSRNTIESVAKLGGLAAPVPGAMPAPTPQGGGTQVLQPQSGHGTDPSTLRSSGPPGVPQVTGSPVTVLTPSAVPTSKAPAVIVAILGTLCVAAAAAYFLVKPAPPKPVIAAPPPPAETAAPVKTAAPIETAAPANTAAPAETAAPADTAAPAAPTGAVAAVPAGKGRNPPGKPAPVTTAKPAVPVPTAAPAGNRAAF
jgi:serine/threonine-protein kinase